MFMLASLLSIGTLHAKDHLWGNGEWIADSELDQNPSKITKAKFIQDQGQLVVEVWYACGDQQCSLGKSPVQRGELSFREKNTVKAAFFPGDNFLMLTFHDADKNSAVETASLDILFANAKDKHFSESELALVNPQLKKNLEDEKKAEQEAARQAKEAQKNNKVSGKLGENADDIPCTCVFNKNRMWNPEKIVWSNQEWQCTEYKQDGTCRSVGVVPGAVVE